MTDWTAIEKDRADGLTLRMLAAKYGVPFTTIAGHFQRHPAYTPGTEVVRTGTEYVQSLPESSTDVVALVKRLIDQLSRIAKDDLNLKEHTLLSQSLSQYFKIMYTAPAQELQQPFDLSILNEQELEQVQTIFSQAEARLNITPIRSNAS